MFSDMSCGGSPENWVRTFSSFTFTHEQHSGRSLLSMFTTATNSPHVKQKEAGGNVLIPLRRLRDSVYRTSTPASALFNTNSLDIFLAVLNVRGTAFCFCRVKPNSCFCIKPYAEPYAVHPAKNVTRTSRAVIGPLGSIAFLADIFSGMRHHRHL